jgi:Family of unknown function (DUF5995)
MEVRTSEVAMSGTIDGVVARMRERLEPLQRTGDPGRFFLSTYLRTTQAVADAVDDGQFEDPAWVEWWDVVFAELYLDALDAHRADPASAPRPWRIALSAPPDAAPVLHVLLGMNAHINYDLPQALLGVISPAQFSDRRLMARRGRDHERIDTVLVTRVADEDGELRAVSGPRRVFDKAMTPVNRRMTMRFLRESRRKVWQNTTALHEARVVGDDAYRRRLGELEVLSSARVRDLMAPGQVIVRLGVAGFGVTLPPA